MALTAIAFDPPPGPIVPTEDFRFPSKDGTTLYGEWFAAEKPVATCIVLHGYAEHCGRYREVANVLVQQNISVLTYDMRGHGKATGQRGHCEDYIEYLDDLKAAMNQARERVDPPTPFLILGHSNGGLIALRALCDPFRCPAGIKAAVISSPFLGLGLKVPLAKDAAGKIAGRVMPRLSLPSELAIDDLTHDPGKLAERRKDTLCHEVASARWYTSALETHEYVHALAHRITVPSLWVVAGADKIADPAAARRVHRRLRSPSRLHVFPEMYHEVFNECDRHEVFGDLIEFVTEVFG
jgi:alpha-beta hydrolase superfamily lysophospholipase